jgi:opacity protein-like surface antigen
MKRLIAVSAMLAGLAIAQSSNAEVTTRLRAGYTFAGDYEVTSDIAFGADALEYEVDYSGVPVGLTVMFGETFYADLAYQSSQGEAKFAWSPQSPDFKRSEWTAAFGARFGKFTSYIGYKDGTSKTDWPTGYYPDEFESSGLVAGFGVSIPIPHSSLNFSLGIGSLKGTYTFAPGESIETDYAFGYSLGAGYTYVFNKHFSATADYKWNKFDYSWEDATISEQLSQATVSAAFSF